MMLALAHRQHGKLPWGRLFEPAIQLAEQGFSISPRLHTLLAADAALKTDPVAASSGALESSVKVVKAAVG